MSPRKRILAECLIIVALVCQLACPYASPPAKHAEKVSIPTEASDQVINDRIGEQIQARGFSDVEVKTHDGQVFLTGYVDDEQQRQTAEEIARRMPGVVEVRNDIVVCKKPPVNLNKPGGPRRC